MSTSETDAGRNLAGDARRAAELADREPEAIEREIDATRADMRATIEALERRWSVDRLIDLTVGQIRARGGEFAGNLTDAATRNPIPLLLTSVGIGWMMLTSRRDPRPQHEGPGVRERMDAARERASRVAGEVHGAVDGAVESTRASLHQAAESSRETLAQTRETLAHTAESLRSGASRAATVTREQVDHARVTMDRLLEEQPLLIGVFGLAAGAIIGALLPTSEHEDRWLGETRDQAVKSVAEKGRALYDTARDQVAAYVAPEHNAVEDDASERPQSRPH